MSNKNVDKVNKNLSMMIHSLSLENEELKAKVTSLEQSNEELTTTNKELGPHLEKKNVELHKMLRSSQK